MDEMELKTSLKQRIFILLITVIMIGSIVAGYAAIVAGGSGGSTDTTITDAKKAQYEEEYNQKLAEFQKATADEYGKYSQYLSRVKKYDETDANTGDVKTRDHVTGSGRELKSGDIDYLAFYVGWCADGSTFDSSLDDAENPTGFAGALVASAGLIEGWTKGVIGMKLGGIREITIPGQYAYQDQKEMCGGYNTPLRFLVMAVENDEALSALASEVGIASMKLQYAGYGLDYEKLIGR